MAASLFLAAALPLGAADALTADEVRKLAKEAYVFGYPLIENYRTMFFFAVDKSSPEYRGPFNTFIHMGRPYSPVDSVAAPNNDTISSFAWLDLRAEPVVVTVPKIGKERYFSMNFVDLYGFNFTSIGTRTLGNGGGNFLITGPNWKGKTPGGITRTFPCETQFAVIVSRLQFLGPGDILSLRALQETFQVRTLNEFLRKPKAPPTRAVSFPGFNRTLASGPGFIDYLNFVLGFCRIHPSEEALLKRLEKIGVAPGKAFNPQGFSPEMMAAIQAGIEDANAEAAEAAVKIRSLFKLYGNREVFKGNYFNRFLGARLGLYAPDWEEVLYIPFGTDADGRPLDGKDGTKYVLYFPPGKLPPVNAFWSLSLYDARTKGFFANPYNRYTLNSSIQPAFQLDADGGLTLYISQYSPGPGPDVNWLPAPAGPFTLTLRLYWPKPQALEGKWMPPQPKKVVAPVATTEETPFAPPFVKETPATPTSAEPMVPRAEAPFIREVSVAPTPTPTPGPALPSTTPLPTIKAPVIAPPFVEGPGMAEPAYTPPPVRQALPVEKREKAPTPQPSASPARQAGPPFVTD